MLGKFSCPRTLIAVVPVLDGMEFAMVFDVLSFAQGRGSALLVFIKQESDSLNASERFSVEVAEDAAVTDNGRHHWRDQRGPCRGLLRGGGPGSKAQGDDQACAEKHMLFHNCPFERKIMGGIAGR